MIIEGLVLLLSSCSSSAPKRFRLFTDKNVDGIFNVMRKPGNKNANRSPDREKQVSVIAQENMKLTVFIIHHWWRFIVDWEVTGVYKNPVHLIVGQKRLKDKYKNPNMLPKVNKADMAIAMELIERYVRSHC